MAENVTGFDLKSILKKKKSFWLALILFALLFSWRSALC